MARYFFDLPNDQDEYGSEFNDAASLRSHALRYASELLRSSCSGERGKDYWRLDVRSETGSIVFYIVSELIPVRIDLSNRPGDFGLADDQPSEAGSDVPVRRASHG